MNAIPATQSRRRFSFSQFPRLRVRSQRRRAILLLAELSAWILLILVVLGWTLISRIDPPRGEDGPCCPEDDSGFEVPSEV